MNGSFEIPNLHMTQQVGRHDKVLTHDCMPKTHPLQHDDNGFSENTVHARGEHEHTVQKV